MGLVDIDRANPRGLEEATSSAANHSAIRPSSHPSVVCLFTRRLVGSFAAMQDSCCCSFEPPHHAQCSARARTHTFTSCLTLTHFDSRLSLLSNTRFLFAAVAFIPFCYVCTNSLSFRDLTCKACCVMSSPASFTSCHVFSLLSQFHLLQPVLLCTNCIEPISALLSLSLSLSLSLFVRAHVILLTK
jgi:hypothetical protein